MVQVRFGDTPASNFVPTSLAQQPFSVEWDSYSEAYTTVIMYDDLGNINLLIANVKGNDVSNGTQVVPYNAPTSSIPRKYNVDVYSQTSLLTNPVRYDVNSFVRNNNLRLINRTSFQVGNLIPTPKSVPLKPVSPTPTGIVGPVGEPASKSDFFLPGTTLTDQQQKWCRCVLKVADKQKGACNIEQAWFQQRDGQQCYNPYAICSKTVGTSVRTCGSNYNFEALSDDHLLAYAQLHQKSKSGNNIAIPSPYNRSQMLKNIRDWKQREGK